MTTKGYCVAESVDAFLHLCYLELILQKQLLMSSGNSVILVLQYGTSCHNLLEKRVHWPQFRKHVYSTNGG